MKLLIIFLILFINLFPQGNRNALTQNDTISVLPYERITLPRQPLIYFPVTSISFGLGNIRIRVLQDETGKPGGDATASNKEALANIGVGEITPYSEIKNRDPYAYNGCGYPAYCFANLEFLRAGYLYEVSMSGSGGCGDCKSGEVSFPRPYMGKEKFFVKVQAAKLIDTTAANNVHLGDFELGSPNIVQKFFFLTDVFKDPFAGTDQSYYKYNIVLYEKINEQLAIKLDTTFSGAFLDLSSFNKPQYLCDTATISVKYGPTTDTRKEFTFRNGNGELRTSNWSFKILPPTKIKIANYGWCFDNCINSTLPEIKIEKGVVRFGFAIDFITRVIEANVVVPGNNSYDKKLFQQLQSQSNNGYYEFIFQMLPGVTIPDGTIIDFFIDYTTKYKKKIQYTFKAKIIN